MMMSKEANKNRKTVGVFLAQISRVWGGEFMAGVEQAAQEHDVNLVCFVGGKPASLMTPGQLQNSYGLYDLVKPNQFDGLILAADIAHGLSPKDIKAFYMRLNDDHKTVAAMDVLVPKIGEIIGGSQREESPGSIGQGGR